MAFPKKQPQTRFWEICENGDLFNQIEKTTKTQNKTAKYEKRKQKQKQKKDGKKNRDGWFNVCEYFLE